MLNETRMALRIGTTAYDAELISLIRAGYRDLQLAGIEFSGGVDFAEDSQTGTWADNSTLDDELAIRAIITYVRMHFGTPPDYDRVQESYETQKAQLMHATGYTDWGDSGC